MASEIGARADFSRIRYSLCWEDADVLLAALDVQPHHVCLSIASAGGNTLALLACSPRRVIALDLSRAQLACLELRVAAYRELTHAELLELLGVRESARRRDLYARCRPLLSPDACTLWDARSDAIALGFGAVGKFERYLAFFGKHILPLIHSRRVRAALMQPRSRAERVEFYEQTWNNRRWRTLFRLFFSRWVIARAGRDPAFFRYVNENVAARLLERTRHALTELDPSENPYLQWIMQGGYRSALPFALREQNFAAIRAGLDRLEWRCQSLEEYLQSANVEPIDRFNLSDIFEYMSDANTQRLLAQLAHHARPGARLAYWNMLVPRRRAPELSHVLRPLEMRAAELHARDKAWFYRSFVLEEVIGSTTGDAAGDVTEAANVDALGETAGKESMA